jgi:hypothetical protein
MADNKNDPQTPSIPKVDDRKADESKISAGSSLGTPGMPPKPAGMTGSTPSGASSPAGGSLGGSPAMGSTPSAATGTGLGSGTSSLGASGAGSSGAGSTGGLGSSSGMGSSPGMGASGAGPSGAGSSGLGSSGAQSSTLSSHTSKPMGAGSGATGAGARSGSSEFSRHQDQGAQNASGGRGGAGNDDLERQAREAADQIRERASDMYESASDWARGKFEAASSSRGARSGGSRGTSSIQRFANENPVLVGVVGLATGLLLGALLPRTRQEDRTFGEWSDEVRQQGLRYATEAVHRGREYAEQALSGDEDAYARHESEFRRSDEAPGAGRPSGSTGGFRNH